MIKAGEGFIPRFIGDFPGNPKGREQTQKGKIPLYVCLECGKKFYTVSSASYARNNGCPKCGGSDIDLA